MGVCRVPHPCHVFVFAARVGDHEPRAGQSPWSLMSLVPSPPHLLPLPVLIYLIKQGALMGFRFQNFDFLNLDSGFSEDELLVRRTARDFVDDNIVPIIEDCFREGRFPRELVPLMGELGFFGANLEGYGCAGMSNVEYGLVTQELERGDSGLRSFVSVQSALVMYPIYTFGSDEQKNAWLPALARGEKLGCFGLTEPGFGSNPGGMTTSARKSGGEYILNGEKMWITSGSIADVAVIWAKVENEDNKVRGFLVETDRPGFSAKDVHGKWSLRASVTSGLALQDVHIPAANLLPGTGGLKSPLMCLNQARYGIGWGAIGAAMSCYDTALQYAKARKQFHGMPIAGHQLIQEKLVWMASEISKAQLLSLHVGRLKDAGKVGHQHISMAKRNNVWMALETARMARDILGANGITEDYPIMRHMMNLESVKTYEGTHDIHALILGQHLTGIAAY
jgi:glutaryl-CoA dehydrogenase